MRAVTKILAGGAVAAALFAAAPAAAQYYPGSPYGGYGGGNVVGEVINQVLGGGYGGYGGGYGGYGGNSQVGVSQCVNAVQARLARNYGGYGGYTQYNAYSQARVLGISRVEPRSNGGLTVRGVASSGMHAYGGYGGGYGGYGGQQPFDLTFRCRVDYRGFITDVDIDRAQINYGSNYGYQPYGGYQSQDPYAAYGYRRY
jgi:hypothetical protein